MSRSITSKKWFSVLVLFATLALASAETDYQRGISQGLWVGLHLGQLLGMAQSGNLTAAEEYNNMLQKYHAGLVDIFGEDQDMLATFSLPRISTPSQSPAYPAVDAVSISRNKTKTGDLTGIITPQPDASGRVHGVPYDAYLMMGPSAADLDKMTLAEGSAGRDVGALSGI